MKSKKIYKYLPFNINSIKILVNGEFWLGVPSKLNDPFEGDFTVKEYSSLPSRALMEFFYETSPELLETTIEAKLNNVDVDYNIFHRDMHSHLSNRLKNHYGVTSFSYLKSDILMWSHYSAGHKGFCIEYDKQLLYETIKYPKDWFSFNDVDYKPYLVEAELTIEKDKIAYGNEKEILNRKLSIWKREKEIRLFAILSTKSKDRYIKFEKKSITGIIFGENMNSEDKITLKNIIHNDKDYSNVHFYNALKHRNRLKMDIIKE